MGVYLPADAFLRRVSFIQCAAGVLAIWTTETVRQSGGVLREIELAQEDGTLVGLFWAQDAWLPARYLPSVESTQRSIPMASRRAFAQAIAARAEQTALAPRLPAAMGHARRHLTLLIIFGHDVIAIPAQRRTSHFAQRNRLSTASTFTIRSLATVRTRTFA